MTNEYKLWKAQQYANEHSSCAKVKVGVLIIDSNDRSHYGANVTIPHVCTGNVDSCSFDGHCISTIHAEIDAIVRAKTSLHMGTMYVTRYPCENCARAIVTAGISKVVYSRPTEISRRTKYILEAGGVEVVHIPYEIV